MKTLLQYEIRKIFYRPLIYLALLLFMALFYMAFLSLQIKWSDGDVIERNAYKEFGGAYAPHQITVIETEIERMLNDPGNYEQGKDSGLTCDASKTVNAMRSIQNEYSKVRIIEDKKGELNVLIVSGKLSKMEAVFASHQLRMLNDLPTMHIEYNKPIAQIIDFFKSMGIIFPVGMILLGLSPMFTDEYKSGMDGLILSSRNGKRQFIIAKLLAACIYAVVSSLIFFLPAVIVIISSYGRLDGWNVPLQMIYGYGLSPFALTAGQYLFVSILFNLLGCTVFALLTVLISSLSQSPLMPVFVAGTVFALPLASEFITFPDAVQALFRYSYTSLSRVEPLYARFDAIGIFGTAVLSRDIMTGAALISIIAFTLLIYRGFSRHQVSN